MLNFSMIFKLVQEKANYNGRRIFKSKERLICESRWPVYINWFSKRHRNTKKAYATKLQHALQNGILHYEIYQRPDNHDL